MIKPAIAGSEPLLAELEPGSDYYWCACGLSRAQPFCDGSHITTLIMPVPFRVTEAGPRYLCTCKQTATPPYCNGAHKSLAEV